MDPATLASQQAAIQDVRAHYERGEITYDALRRALDALVLAQDADDCQAILRALPRAPLAPLAALEPPGLPAAAITPAPYDHRIVAFMSQTKKLRRPWRLLPRTLALALMGEIQLDLRLAELPPRARMQVTAIMGTVTLYVPPEVHVTVRSTVLLSDTTALGESTAGVMSFGHEQHSPTNGPATADLTIEVFALMASVKVVVKDPSEVSVAELVRDALRAAAAGVKRGLQQGASSRPALDTGSLRDAGRPSLPRPATPPHANA